MTRSDEPFRIQADFCKAMAHPVRLQIIDLLKGRPNTVTGIVRALGVGQANASQHLAVLRARGVVRTERRGNGVLYSLADRRIVDACGLIQEILMGQARDREAAISLQR